MKTKRTAVTHQTKQVCYDVGLTVLSNYKTFTINTLIDFGRRNDVDREVILQWSKGWLARMIEEGYITKHACIFDDADTMYKVMRLPSDVPREVSPLWTI